MNVSAGLLDPSQDFLILLKILEYFRNPDISPARFKKTVLPYKMKTNTSQKIVAALLGASALCLLTTSASAAIAVSNATNSSQGSTSSSAFEDFGDTFYTESGGSFTTGLSAMNLDLIRIINGTTNGSDFVVGLFSDNGSGLPDSMTATLNLSGVSNGVEFSPSSAITLSPSTTYHWAVLAETGSSVGMRISNDPSETSTEGWTIGNGLIQHSYSSSFDNGWIKDNLYTVLFEVEASPTPEPSAALLSLIAAGLSLVTRRRR